MKIVRVGGPLLGRRESPSTEHDPRLAPLAPHATLEPLITPPLSQSKQEQFVILPSLYFIDVLSYKTGRRVACLVPRTRSRCRDDDVVVQSVCLASCGSTELGKTAEDILRDTGTDDDSVSSSGTSELRLGDDIDDNGRQVLLVGCDDGTLCEFPLNTMTHTDRAEKGMDCGPCHIMGPCFRPRRVFRLTDHKQPIRHMTAPLIAKRGSIVYALSERKRAPSTGTSAAKVVFSMLRMQLPSFDESTCTSEVIDLFKDPSLIQVKDTIKCRVGRDKKGHFEDSTPFRMMSAAKKVLKPFSSSESADQDVFVVIGRTTTFHIYHERFEGTFHNPSSKSEIRSLSFTVAPPNMLSALCIAPNGADVTCGYQEGDIRVMSNLLPKTLEYMDAVDLAGRQGPAVKHPSKTVLVRRVHWHAHPVSTLAYHGMSNGVDPMLYSGGEESVLVTWQLSRGSYRPADVLPRLAKGSIVHICCGDATQEGVTSGILVFCEDNSLQLLESHNRSLLWKIQGLARSGARGKELQATASHPAIRSPAHFGNANTLILTGLSGAPGYIHWFDYHDQRVTDQLEVAPYNRVSRMEKDDVEMPAPSITHCRLSNDEQVLLTVDTSPTENESVGASERLNWQNTVGVVSTLRLWTRNPKSKKVSTESTAPYSLTAAMTHPHGEENKVSAVAISCDGCFACTVSNDENAFRVWHRVLSQGQDEDQRSRRNPSWTCKYKVTTPSGYSNFATRHDAVAFSNDGTVLSVAYGNMITLWDYKEATLLKSLRHLDDDWAPVEAVEFIKTDYLHDLLLTRSFRGIRIQSPYGNAGQAAWACSLPVDYKHAMVSHAELIPSDNVVVICMSLLKERKSRILFLNAVTGSAMKQKTINGSFKPVAWELDGVVQSMGSYSNTRKEMGWVPLDCHEEGKSTAPASPSSMGVFVAMQSGDLLLLQTDGDSDPNLGNHSTSSPYDSQGVPRLAMLKRGKEKKRRKEDPPTVSVNGDSVKAALSFGSLPGRSDDTEELETLLSSDLPALNGAFTHAFVGRGLAKRRRQSD